jgi:hypothetical protein
MDKYKYFGPWIIDKDIDNKNGFPRIGENEFYHRRLSINDKEMIYFYKLERIWIGYSSLNRCIGNIDYKKYKSQISNKDMMSFIDNNLIDRGCVLLNSEQFNKLKILV